MLKSETESRRLGEFSFLEREQRGNKQERYKNICCKITLECLISEVLIFRMTLTGKDVIPFYWFCQFFMMCSEISVCFQDQNQSTPSSISTNISNSDPRVAERKREIVIKRGGNKDNSQRFASRLKEAHGRIKAPLREPKKARSGSSVCTLPSPSFLTPVSPRRDGKRNN